MTAWQWATHSKREDILKLLSDATAAKAVKAKVALTGRLPWDDNGNCVCVYCVCVCVCFYATTSCRL